MRRVHETIVAVEEQLVLRISLCMRVCARAREGACARERGRVHERACM
jgi:hypothetical protein